MANKIVTSGLEGEFKRLTTVTGGREVLAAAVGEKQANRMLTGQVTSNTRVVEPFFSPWVQRTTVELPTAYKEQVKWRRYFYHNEPIVQSAISLHSQFPLSTFWISHKDKVIRDGFEKMCEDIELFDFLLEALHEYWCNGEVTPFGFFDDEKEPNVWDGFILLDPVSVDVQWDPLARGRRKEVLKLELSKTIKDVVDGGPSDEKTGELYKKLPEDVKAACKKDGKMDLNPIQVSRIKRTGDYFSVRGTSIIDSAFKWLMYRDKLRSAQYAVADRHITPKEFYMIGEPGAPGTQEEIDNLSALLAAQWTQPNAAIVYHHALRIQWEGANGKILAIGPEFTYIDKQLAIALLINEGIVTAERQPYASTSIGLDVMIQRYLTLRMRVKKWVQQSVFKPICEIHKIVKRTQVELNYGIRFNKREPDYDIPEVKWDREEIRNDMQKIQMLKDMASDGKIPWKMVFPLLDLDPDEVRKGLVEEAQANAAAGIGLDSAMPVGGGGVGGGSFPSGPPEGGGEGTPEEAAELGLPNAPEGEGGFGKGAPPESSESSNLPQGI
jgi:hypothetical protein